MQANLVIIGMLAGGLGLFLLSVSMITDGLKLATGTALRELLGRSTSSPLKGIISGFSITAIVQSSSAVTLATIGFVNAGLLTMYQALGVVYGANIGTSMTGWLVAIVGFRLNIEAFALPIIGIGMLLRLRGGTSRHGAIGTALAGFGLFFLGIDVLKDAFENFVDLIDLERFTAQGVTGILLFLGVGFLMTVLTQSSSAAIAITLTAATGGVLGTYAAAAMVIGANVGTTSTAVFSVIGATPNAKRVAAAHVVFNLMTGMVALILLPIMFQVVDYITRLLDLDQVPVVTLALFHSVFNVLGVLLMLPLSNHLAHFLERRLTSLEEIESRPLYLDRNVALSPVLALNAAVLELTHLFQSVRGLSNSALSDPGRTSTEIQLDLESAEQLAAAIGNFVVHLERATMPTEIALALPKVLRTNQYYLIAAELAAEINSLKPAVGEIRDQQLLKKLAEFRTETMELLSAAEVGREDFSMADCENRLDALHAHYDDLKEFILYIGADSGIGVSQMSALLEQSSNTRRLAEQIVKAARYLSLLYISTRMVANDSTEADSDNRVTV